ncbi:integrase [Tanacetum coccineum]
MDHDQTNEPSGPHETHDGDETSQIKDEGKPNNDEFETNESNEGEKPRRGQDHFESRIQPSRFKDFVVQVPPSVNTQHQTSNRQFVADPRNNHLEVANRVLGYLKATPSQGILISRAGDPVLTAYCDSDWLGCPYTRRSRTGYMLLLGQWPPPLVRSFGF